MTTYEMTMRIYDDYHDKSFGSLRFSLTFGDGQRMLAGHNGLKYYLWHQIGSRNERVREIEGWMLEELKDKWPEHLDRFVTAEITADYDSHKMDVCQLTSYLSQAIHLAIETGGYTQFTTIRRQS